MRTTIRHIGEAEEKQMSLLAFMNENGGSVNDTQRERMKHIIRLAIENELTDRQRECICRKYFGSMKAAEIAQELHISTATVYKHIRKGIAAMKHCAIYL